MNKAIRLLFAGMLIFSMAAPAQALFGFPETLEGTVRAIDANVITVVSEKEDGSSIQEVSFLVNEETKLEEIASLNELQEGDQVEIKYKEDGNIKVATQIARQENDAQNQEAQHMQI